MATNESCHAIDNHDLAVVAEIDLEAVEPPSASSECPYMHTRLPKGFAVMVGQCVAADPVVKHIDLNALRRFFQEQALQLSTDHIVMNDEKLDEDSISRLTDGLEDGIKGRLAIDQQVHFVVGQAGHATQLGHGP
ncbi:hypothetical protein D3C80_843720 [compost metagenome]